MSTYYLKPNQPHDNSLHNFDFTKPASCPTLQFAVGKVASCIMVVSVFLKVTLKSAIGMFWPLNRKLHIMVLRDAVEMWVLIQLSRGRWLEFEMNGARQDLLMLPTNLPCSYTLHKATAGTVIYNTNIICSINVYSSIVQVQQIKHNNNWEATSVSAPRKR